MTVIFDESLKKKITYEPETGLFFWLTGRNAGKPLGDSLSSKGYRRVKIGKSYVRLHRLAFFLMGEEVPEQVDHIDRNRTNNKWVNLRGCNSQTNALNRKTRVDNTLGVKGVEKRGNSYRARIYLDGKPTYLGLFKTLEEASEAYEEAVVKMHEPLWAS